MRLCRAAARPGSRNQKWVSANPTARRVLFKIEASAVKKAAARTEPLTQKETTRQMDKTVAAGPFLAHAALTPAQKEYLYAVAASYSTAHVRHLLSQHYINVLHRWKRTSSGPDRDHVAVTPHESENGKDQSKSQSDVSSRVKHKGRKNTSTQHPGKSFLPELPTRQKSFSNTSASKQRKTKKQKTLPKIKRSPRRCNNILLKEEEEEGQADSLSQCLSSLSVGGWDEHSFSDSVNL